MVRYLGFFAQQTDGLRRAGLVPAHHLRDHWRVLSAGAFPREYVAASLATYPSHAEIVFHTPRVLAALYEDSAAKNFVIGDGDGRHFPLRCLVLPLRGRKAPSSKL